MLLLKGLLSLIQVVFLPGFLLLVMLKLNRGVIKTLVLSFALSLIINHYLVYLLTLIHLYNSTVMYCILALEALVTVHLLFHYPSDQKYPAVQTKNLLEFINQQSPFRLFILFVALLPLFFFIIHYFESGRNTVFVVSDAILRWNAWATTWFHGHISHSDSNYPQLMPINWSMTYVFLQTDFIQLFAKLINFFAPIAILLTLFDLAFRKRDFGYIWAVIAVSVLWYVLLGPITYQGYADMLCSFMALITVYLLLLTEEEPHNANKYIVLSIITCAGAAITKQAGIYMACVYPLFFWFQQENRINSKEKIRWIMLSIALLVVLIVPFYLFTHLPPMMQRFSFDNVAMSGFSYYKLSYIQRTQFGILVLLKELNIYFLCGISLLIILSLFFKSCSKKIFIVIFPYLIIWLLFYSYDIRNLILILSFLSICMGIFLNYLMSPKLNLRITICQISFIALIIVLSIIAFEGASKHFLADQYYTRAQYIGNIKLNTFIYRYFSKNKRIKDYIIITNMPFLQELPRFENKIVFDSFYSKKSYSKYLNKNRRTYIILNKDYLALINNCLKNAYKKQTIHSVWFNIYGGAVQAKNLNEEINRTIKNRIMDNNKIKTYKIIFSTDNILFMEINY